MAEKTVTATREQYENFREDSDFPVSLLMEGNIPLWNTLMKQWAKYLHADYRRCGRPFCLQKMPDFSGIDLTGIFFDQIHLSGANFKGAILTGAHFGEGTYMPPDFEGADLSGATFETLYGCQSFRHTNCKNAQFKSHPSAITFEGANLSGASFLKPDDSPRASLAGTLFMGAICVNTNFSNAILSNAKFDQANCTGADFSGVTALHTSMRGADCSKANFQGARFWLGNFDQANCSGANFKRTELPYASFLGATVQGANFEEAWLKMILLNKEAPEFANMPPLCPDDPRYAYHDLLTEGMTKEEFEKKENFFAKEYK